jgi:hypothetical protein
MGDGDESERRRGEGWRLETGDWREGSERGQMCRAALVTGATWFGRHARVYETSEVAALWGSVAKIAVIREVQRWPERVAKKRWIFAPKKDVKKDKYI